MADVLRLLDGANSRDVRGLRDRALLELLYSSGARISEAVGLDVDDVNSAERTVLLNGKGGRQRLVPIGRPALEALDAYLVRARPVLAARGKGDAAVFLNSHGGRFVPAERVERVEVRRRPGGDQQRGVAARAAAFVRHPSAGRRSGRASGAGIARARLGDDHAGVHAGHGEHVARGVRDRPSEGVAAGPVNPWSGVERISPVLGEARLPLVANAT
ncbi:hypothetical protein GCM10020366_70260 [Saccharopolyspora gregorii]|uniref:Tyr recombinase domain-containing protein n=1 Tax=Saccharopolyspora gregorii TaxID=33914 RepID=A0ABP6S2V5_9PSEU